MDNVYFDHMVDVLSSGRVPTVTGRQVERDANELMVAEVGQVRVSWARGFLGDLYMSREMMCCCGTVELE